MRNLLADIYLVYHRFVTLTTWKDEGESNPRKLVCKQSAGTTNYKTRPKNNFSLRTVHGAQPLPKEAIYYKLSTSGGEEGIRTLNLFLAKELRYRCATSPLKNVGLPGFEPGITACNTVVFPLTL